MDEIASQKLLDLERDMARKDVMFFRHRVCGYDLVGKDFHLDMDRLLNRPSRFKLINIPRNHFKTTEVLSWCLWRILNDSNLSILYEMAIYDQAKKAVLEMRQKIESERWRGLFGSWEGQPWADNAFTVGRRSRSQIAPTLSASGLDRTQTGQHYDIIVFDDLVDEKNHKTHDGREKAKDRLRYALSVLKTHGVLILVGTPWDAEDLYAWVKEDPKIRQVFDEMILDIYRDDEGKPARMGQIGNELLMPEFFCENLDEELKTGKQSLEMLRVILGPFQFSCQYRVNATLEDFSEFKKSWLLWSPDEEVAMRMQNPRTKGKIILFCDPAMGKETTLHPCDSAIVGGHFMRDRRADVFLEDAGRYDPGETIERLIRYAKAYKADEVRIEAVLFSETMVTETERRLRLECDRPIQVVPVSPRQGGDHHRRIRNLFPFYRFGQIRHAESLRDGRLEEQLIRFPKGSLIDLADAWSQFTFTVDFPMGKPQLGILPEDFGAKTVIWSQRAPKDAERRKKKDRSYIGNEFWKVG